MRFSSCAVRFVARTGFIGWVTSALRRAVTQR